MTVAELIKELEQCKSDAQIVLEDLSGENFGCEEVQEIDDTVFIGGGYL